MTKQTILCVDDEIDNVEALERLLRKHFHILKATSGEEGLGLLSKHPEVSVILSDQRMPKMTGVEFLNKSLPTHPDSIRILLTGYTDIESVIDAINMGQIYRYISKPWDPTDLIKTCQEASEKYFLKKELAEKNKSLEKAIEELKTLDQTKSQFMILINHELKTPLTSIINYLELLKESQPTEEQVKYLDRISQASYRLKNMMDDVLKVISGETGLLKINKQKIILKPDFLKIWQQTESLIKQKNILLKMDIEEVQLELDPTILLEVLNRLLQNAAQFSPPDSQIQLKIHQTEGGVHFELQNPSNPIQSQVLDRLLKPFTLNEDIMKHSKGLGLGLSVCQSLLKNSKSNLKISYLDSHFTAEFTIS